MKNKKANAAVYIIIAVIAAIAIIAVVYMIASRPINVQVQGGNTGGTTGTVIASSSCQGSNPLVSPVFVNQLTNGSITAGIMNAFDSNNALLGPVTVASGVMTPPIGVNAVIIPVVNASGYLTEIQPSYTVTCGPQSVKGNLYQQVNASVIVYDNVNAKNVGAATFATVTSNSTVFSVPQTEVIKLFGTNQKSTGKIFMVYEVSNTTAVQSVTLTPVNGAAAPITATVPNCYTNTLTGTPFRVAFEIPAIVNGAEQDYNLVITPAVGVTVSGKTQLSMFSEQDGIDSLSSGPLTSGICDGNNRFFGYGGIFSATGSPVSNNLGGGQISWQWTYGNVA